MTLIFFAIGLIILIAGAEALVRGASRLASTVGISPLVVGLTVVAFGTSSPELAVSVIASVNDKADISLGNVIGSNILNVLFILGLSAVIVPLAVSRQIIRLDVPIMIICSVLVLIMGLDGSISRTDGILFTAGIIAYTVFLIRQSRKEKERPSDEFVKEYKAGGKKTLLIDIALVAAGLGLLVLGSRWLVNGAVMIATYLGLSELIIGLTIVAAGTSLPEVATSVIASIRGERDIAVGNIVGSNIFNILAVLGISGIAAPDGIAVPESVLRFDIPVMTAVAVACLPIFFTGNVIARWEGKLFLLYYAAYTTYIVLDSTDHYFERTFAFGMIWFVIPLTAITLAVLVIRSIRRNRKGYA
ncbi:MAG TPA: calcium/sodium antiporter [Thermodesulfobacteriota bacterium]|nr:calcium/sodium antiporter [Thermodesulfobacteriota bacterium]